VTTPCESAVPLKLFDSVSLLFLLLLVVTLVEGVLFGPPGDWRPVPVPRDSASAVPLKIFD